MTVMAYVYLGLPYGQPCCPTDCWRDRPTLVEAERSSNGPPERWSRAAFTTIGLNQSARRNGYSV